MFAIILFSKENKDYLEWNGEGVAEFSSIILPAIPGRTISPKYAASGTGTDALTTKLVDKRDAKSVSALQAQSQAQNSSITGCNLTQELQ